MSNQLEQNPGFFEKHKTTLKLALASAGIIVFANYADIVDFNNPLDKKNQPDRQPGLPGEVVPELPPVVETAPVIAAAVPKTELDLVPALAIPAQPIASETPDAPAIAVVSATATPEATPAPVPAHLPDNQHNEDPALGFRNEDEPLLSSEAIQNLIGQTLTDLEQHPEQREQILAGQRWIDDLLNPMVTKWLERNFLLRDNRGLGFTPDILRAAANQDYDWLYTKESLAAAEDPQHQNSAEVLLQFAVNIIALARTEQLPIGVADGGARYYLVDYSNIANMQPNLFVIGAKSLVDVGASADDEVIRNAAAIFADSWRWAHGLTRGAGLTSVDTNGPAAGGEVPFRYDPFLNVCEVHQLPGENDDPINQRETTRRIDVRPLFDSSGKLIQPILWESRTSNARGRYVTAVRIDETLLNQLLANGSGDAEWIAQQLLAASAETTWNFTDIYTDISLLDYESPDVSYIAVGYTFVPCGAGQPTSVIIPEAPATPVIPSPPQTCEETGTCPPPPETPEKSPPGNQTNLDGETAPDPEGGLVIIDGEIDTDGDGQGDTTDNIGSGR